MVHDISYRRSFHCEGDLRAIERLFERDQASCVARKSTSYDGFEAPRNSLDVPLGNLLRRPNEPPRIEDIPMGYELTRGLKKWRQREAATAGSRGDRPTSNNRKEAMASSKWDPPTIELTEPKQFRTSSVIARLMGLDPLPNPEADQLRSSSNVSNCSRTQINHRLDHLFDTPSSSFRSHKDSFRSQMLGSFGGVDDCDGDHVSSDEGPPQDLSFRKHPQEKQLQDFKREFIARQALQKKNGWHHDWSSASSSSTRRRQALLSILDDTHPAPVGSPEESQDILDALDFLYENKDVFMKVLNDPCSALANPVSRQNNGGIETPVSDARKPVGSRHASRNSCDSYQGGYCSKDFMVNKERRTQEAYGSFEKAPPPPARAREASSESCRYRGEEALPTRIVVLTPNYSCEQEKMRRRRRIPLLRSLNPQAKDDMDFDLENMDMDEFPLDDDDDEEAHLQKIRMKEAEEFRMKEAEELARQIVKQAKEEMRARLSCTSMDRPPRLARRSLQVHRDKNGYFWEPSVAKCSDRPYSSLPSSPRISSSRNEPPFHNPHPKRFGGSGVHETSSSSSGATQQNAVTARSSSKNSRGEDSVQGARSRKPAETIVSDGDAAKVSKQQQQQKKKKKATDGCIVTKTSSRSRSPPLANARTTTQIPEQRIEVARSNNVGTSSFKASALGTASSSAFKRSDKKCDGSMRDSPTKEPQPDRTRFAPSSASKIEHSMDSSTDEIFSDNNSAAPNGFDQSTSATDPGDTASESSIEKCEQPSPVSVLQTPFQEEDNTNPTESIGPRTSNATGSHMNDGPSTPPEQTSPLPECNDTSRSRLLHSHATAQEQQRTSVNLSADALHVGDIELCAPRREDELAYVREVFAFCGITTTRDEMITEHVLSSMGHGLDPSIFEKLEKHWSTLSENNSPATLSLDSWQRRLLFDAVDEILFLKLRDIASDHPYWSNPVNRRPHLLCTGRQLLQRTWSEICCCSPPESSGMQSENLEDYVSKDLMKRTMWGVSQDHIRMVVAELERHICGDLIREAVHENFVRR